MTEQKGQIKLCDQMDLGKITLKWMLNLCLCRWKIDENESNYRSLVQLLHLVYEPQINQPAHASAKWVARFKYKHARVCAHIRLHL